MTKASSLLALILVCTGVHTAQAQFNTSQTPEEDLVRRQEKAVILRNTLESAQTTVRQGDLPAAAKLYEKAWQLVEELGSYADAERGATIAGFSSVRLELAQRAAKAGDFNE